MGIALAPGRRLRHRSFAGIGTRRLRRRVRDPEGPAERFRVVLSSAVAAVSVAAVSAAAAVAASDASCENTGVSICGRSRAMEKIK